MKRPGEVLLLACYELGHQPLSLASPLGRLAEAGYRPAAFDLSLESLPTSAVTAARFVGIAVPMHTALRIGEAAARHVRQINPSAHVCFYGLYAWLNADHLLRELADSVIAGEYEEPLLNLIQSLENGDDAPIAGVRACLVIAPRPRPRGREAPARTRASRIFKQALSDRRRRAAPHLRRIPFALPKRDALPPLDRYARLADGGEPRLAGYVEASRGCRHTCRHCPITPVYHGRFFVVPADIVLADIRAQIRAGATHITFGDPDFLNGPGHSLRIVRELHAEFPSPRYGAGSPRVTFDFTAKVEHIIEHRRLMPEFRRRGCAFVVSAFESTSDVVLARLEKGHTRADMETALEIMSAADIPLRPSFVAFTPWTTLDDYVEMLENCRHPARNSVVTATSSSISSQ